MKKENAILEKINRIEKVKKYWVCIIGEANPEHLKMGSDSPLRKAVKEAYGEETGYDCRDCWSGWDSSLEQVEVLKAVWCMDKEDPIYDEIKNILKKHGRL